jgi:hypothetical protein
MLHEEIPLVFRCRHSVATQKLQCPTLKFVTNLSLIRPNKLRAVELRNKAKAFVWLASEPDLVLFAAALLLDNPERSNMGA